MTRKWKKHPPFIRKVSAIKRQTLSSKNRGQNTTNDSCSEKITLKQEFSPWQIFLKECGEADTLETKPAPTTHGTSLRYVRERVRSTD